MDTFVVLPVSREIAAKVRATGRAAQYDHPVHREISRGTGPCRECLRPFDVGAEERLLFTYDPFERDSMLPQPGPIFIHAHACAPHRGTGFPEGLCGIPLVAQPYQDDGTIGETRVLPAGGEAVLLTTLLAEPRVRFLHLRHGEAGCYIARVERVRRTAVTA
jgi:hypothetical protein